MTFHPATEAVCRDCASSPGIETAIEPKSRELGASFRVGRVLPAAARRMVGPFIFFDHMGPVRFEAGQGLDVPPHPHINLATVTYLFDGEIVHRDSLGSHRAIRPGAINWMTAGRGITHSERTGPSERARGAPLHGIQLWVALPKEYEEIAPEFHHHPSEALPELQVGGVGLRVLAGAAYGAVSPVKTFSPLFYAEAVMPAGSELSMPEGYTDRAAYLVEGTIVCGDERCASPQMLVFRAGADATFKAERDSRVMLIGGEPLEGPRHIWWNFVSSSRERIEAAKRDWAEGRFPPVPGDERDYIPLPKS